MPLPPDLPVVDHHCHLSPSGEGVAAARRFKAAGGTHLFLATQNYTPARVPLRLDDYRAQFDLTESLAHRITEETGVVVYPVVAPYPIDLVHAEPALGLAGAISLYRAALELAAREVEEHRAVALGEVGRPHFAVPPPVAEACEESFRYALELARDAGCPAIVHSEDLDPDGYRRLAGLAAQAGLPLHKLVKHYARSVLSVDERTGVVPSYLARRDTARSSLDHPGPWFWETDFLDDPARPGAVLDIATVPRRAEALCGDAESLDRLRVPFVESVERVYGFTPTAARGGRP